MAPRCVQACSPWHFGRPGRESSRQPLRDFDLFAAWTSGRRSGALRGWGWEGFKADYEARGYMVIADPPLLHRLLPAEPTTWRPRNPALAQVGINETINGRSIASSARSRAATPDRYNRRRHRHAGPARPGPRRGGVAIQPCRPRRAGCWTTKNPIFPKVLVGELAPEVMTMLRRSSSTRSPRSAPRAGRSRWTTPTSIRCRKVYWDELVSAPGTIRWDNSGRAPCRSSAAASTALPRPRSTKAMFERQKQALFEYESKSIRIVGTGPVSRRS